MLDEFITANREEIISRCRSRVVKRSIPPPTEAEIDHGVPLFLEQLVDALRTGAVKVNSEIAKSALSHGHDLLLQGFTVSQVVHDYGDICQVITALSVEKNSPISAEDFRTFNKCLDDAIAGAVTEYGREQNQAARNGENVRGNERLGFLAHELRNLANTAVLAFEVLKTGNVGVGGSTGAVLERSLLGMRALVERSLAEVRFTKGIHHRERFEVSAFIEELAAAATLEASGRGITLVVLPVEPGLALNADRQVLGAVIGNLLQNAFKFTRPASTVRLTVFGRPERVLIEVQDECGGFPGGVAEIFRPFDQRSADRTGVGLGLAFSRWGVESNDGQIYVRNVPEQGCVFILDLPRVDVPESVVV